MALFAVTWLGGGPKDPAMLVSLYAAVMAGANALVASVALLVRNEQHLYLWAAASYSLLVATTAVLILTSGGVASPYVALWILVAAFGGLFGAPGLLSLALLINGYLAWQFMAPSAGLTNEKLLMFALASDLPLVVSYIIWHGKAQQHGKKEEKVTQLTRELSQISNKSEIVINAIGDGVLALDSKGTILLLNPAAQSLLGWNKAEAVGLDYGLVMKLTSKQDQPINGGQNPIEQVRVIKQVIVNNELTLTSKAGKKMITSLVVSPMLDENRNVAGIIVVFRDITAETKAQREQAEFISTASHEMRTPVAAIEGYLALALNPQTAQLDNKARTYLTKAQESVKHLGRLFQDLLTVTRAEDNRLQQHPLPTNMVAFLASVTESLQPKAAEKGLKLSFAAQGNDTEDGQRKLSPVYYANLDRDHLREIAANLIENAIKYTKTGEVIVDVVGDDRHVTLSVKDSGIGIPKEDIPHLFEKFYRVDSSDTREIGGTGLGLYICRRLAESMRGSIRVESELGRGSTFLVTFPRLSGAQVRQLQDSEAIEEAAAQRLSSQPPSPTPVVMAPTAPAQPPEPLAAPVPQPMNFESSPPQPVAPPANSLLQPQQIAQQAAAPRVPSGPNPQPSTPTISELQARWHASHPTDAPPQSVKQVMQDVYQPATTAAGRGSLSIPERPSSQA